MTVTENFIKSWVALQGQLIRGLHMAYVDLQGPAVRSGALAVCYPETDGREQELALAARLAQRSRAPVTTTAMPGEADGETLRIAFPLQLGEEAAGAVVVEVDGPLERQAAVIQSLQWGEAWLRLALSQQQDERADPGYGDLVARALKQLDHDDTLTTVLALLPGLVAGSRVALGASGGKRIELLGVSAVADLDRRGLRARLLREAMAEALAANATLAWPTTADDSGDGDSGDGAPDRSAQALLAESGRLNGVITVPVSDGLPEPLVFVFEFSGELSPDSGSMARCSEAAHVVAPLLALRRESTRPWPQRLLGLCREGASRLLPKTGRWRRLVVLALLLAALVFVLTPAAYRVSAPATLEGSVQQAVVAPFDGYIADAVVRAGQQVGQGQVLARLDDRELVAERRRLRAEENELSEQHRQAVATLDHSQARILQAQLDQNRARLALVQERLERTELKAPLDGLVISGDWSRSLGVPVSRGDLLFQVAPLADYRIALEVSDRDIAGFAVGQQGELTLSAMPRESLRFTVVGISPLAPEKVAEPAFLVEGRLQHETAGLRPGMQGVAKVTLGLRQRWWIWTHGLTDWLRLELWRRLP